MTLYQFIHGIASCRRLIRVGLRSTYVSSTDESYVPSGLDNIRNVNNCLILE